MKPDLRDDAVYLATIKAFVRRKLAILNLQLAATLVAALAIVLLLGWSRDSLLFAAALVGLGNAGQGIGLIRGFPLHLRMNRESPALVHDLNRMSLWTEIGFVAVWLIVTLILIVAALRAPVAP